MFEHPSLRVVTVLLLAFVATAVAPAHAAPAIGDDIATVSRLRGHDYKYPVTEKKITRAALRHFLRKQLESGLGMPVDSFFESLAALQLVESSPESVDRLLDLYESQVLAFYDPRTGTYYNITTPPPAAMTMSPLLEQGIAIHELTHALQDQRFNAGKTLESLRSDWDAEMAYQAVLEGEATLVMFAALYEKIGKSLEELIGSELFVAALAEVADSNDGIPAGVDSYFVESMKFPYVAGVAFVVEAFRRGGWEAIDAIHASPPKTTAEISRPELYFSKDRHDPARPPFPSLANPILTTTLGEFHWKYLVGEEGARDWKGDRVQVGGSGKRLSVRAVTEWAGQAAARRFAGAYGALLRSKGLSPDIRIEGDRVSVDYSVPRSSTSKAARGK
ncbi:MAG TPA: hypothetical protein VMT00_11795 [Thermoanaerobaculia bacterium]|nr:hypothetical protein [Thermoanaerobaculia bacterium]